MILLARMAGEAVDGDKNDAAPLYIVHLTNALGLDYIRRAREQGQKNLYAETCPQYLFLDDSLYTDDAEGLKYIMCPPLRKAADQEALWGGLASDINTVATDHCPFFFATQKMQGKEDFTKCPSGAPGIEERIPLMFSEGVQKGRISLRRFVELCSTNPAKVFGMYPKKGVIKEGSDADITIIDPEKKVTLGKAILHENVDYSAYEGMQLNGYPVTTISRGEVIVDKGQFLGKKGRGEFILRQGH
jgi:dihydropyrimidinase